MRECTVFEQILARIKNNRFVAILLVVGVFVIVVATFIESLIKIVRPLKPNTQFYLNSPLKPFPGGVVELNVPPRIKSDGDLLVEAVHAPKKRENSEHRYYDVFLRSISKQPITLVAVIVDSEVAVTLGPPKPSRDRGPAYPDVNYDLTYRIFVKDQRIPLTSPYRIPANGTGAFRIHLEPLGEYKKIIASRIQRWGVHIMSLQLVDSNDRKKPIVYLDPGMDF